MSNVLAFPKLLTPKETAQLLRVSVGTLSQWRHHQRYPLRFIRLGRAIRYREEDVRAFLERGEVAS